MNRKLVLSVLKQNPGMVDMELIAKCGASRGTFYKKILHDTGFDLTLAQ